MKDVRVQLGIGAISFCVALIDSFATHAESLGDLSVVGKISTAIVTFVIAWFVVRYLVIGLIFKK